MTLMFPYQLQESRVVFAMNSFGTNGSGSEVKVNGKVKVKVNVSRSGGVRDYYL